MDAKQLRLEELRDYERKEAAAIQANPMFSDAQKDEALRKLRHRISDRITQLERDVRG